MDMGLARDSAKKADPGRALNQYFDRLVSGQIRLRPMPGALGTLLREQGRYRINDPGVAHGLELALAQQQKQDSGGASGMHAPGPGLKPAPGPAPVPNSAPSPPPGGKAPGGDSTGNNATGEQK
jgi:hypothetical protein